MRTYMEHSIVGARGLREGSVRISWLPIIMLGPDSSVPLSVPIIFLLSSTLVNLPHPTQEREEKYIKHSTGTVLY